MERSALYRRALAPIMIYNGAVGTAAAITGWASGLILRVDSSFLGVCCQRRAGWVFFAGQAAGTQGRRAVLVAANAPNNASDAAASCRRDDCGCGDLFLRNSRARKYQQCAGDALVAAGVGGLVWLCVSCGGFFYAARDETFWLGFCIRRDARCSQWEFPDRASGQCRLWQSWDFSLAMLHLAYGIYLYFTEQRRNET